MNKDKSNNKDANTPKKKQINIKKAAIIVFVVLALVAVSALIKQWKEPPIDANKKIIKLADKYIKLSDNFIEIAKGIKIKIARLVLETDHAILYLKVDQSETELNIAPFTYVVRNERGKEIYNNTSQNKEMIYVEELKLPKLNNIYSTLELEIKQNDGTTLVKFDINYRNQKVKVIGGEKELEKISEEELNEYLGAFALLNYNDDKVNLEILDEINLKNTRKIMAARQIAKINNQSSSAKDNEIVNSFTQALEGTTENISINENVKGKCVEIKDKLYVNGIYTVTFTYNYETTADISENRTETLPLYEMTIGLTINEDQTYSKYRVSNITDSTLVENKGKPKKGKNFRVKETTDVQKRKTKT